jgi:hypothetical protein
LSDETIVVAGKRRAAKVLLPEPAGPHKTSRVLRGILMMCGVVMCYALLPLLCIPSFDIMALHI